MINKKRAKKLKELIKLNLGKEFKINK